MKNWSFGFLFLAVVAQAAPEKQSLSFQVPGQDREVKTEISGNSIHWSRKVKTYGTHVTIEDTISTDAPDLSGVKISHSIKTPYNRFWLGGQDYEALIKNIDFKHKPSDFSDPWNPTVFSVSKSGSVGLVAEDDIFRQQVRLFYEPKGSLAGMKSESLCLLSKNKIKLSFSIYFSPSKNYWDFLNQVRADWNVNQTINGSFFWFQPGDILKMPADVLAKDLAAQKIEIANMYGGWVDDEKPNVIGFGVATLLPEFAHLREVIQKAIQKLKTARPGIQVLVYFDAQRDSSPNANQLYPDSLFLNSDGSEDSTTWLTKFNRTWSTFPTLSNSLGKKLFEVVEETKKMGADGLYWDEMEGLDYSGVRATSKIWDGFSCVLDSDQKVLMKIAYVNLLSEEAKLQYAEKGGLIFANSPPTTRKFQNRPDLHMIEGQHRVDYSSFAELTTPLAYIGSDDDWKSILAPIEKGLIPASVRLEYTTTFFSRLFPITPVKLYSGLILGTERIVATRSGVYGWKNRCDEVKTYQFDSGGKEIKFSGTLSHVPGACQIKINLKKNEALILERVSSHPKDAVKKPLFFDPVFL